MEELSFSNIELIDLMNGLRSIKLREIERQYVLDSIRLLSDNGDLSISRKIKIREIGNRYSVALKKLYKAREKAKKTNNLKRLGISVTRSNELVAHRRAEIEKRRIDRGI